MPDAATLDGVIAPSVNVMAGVVVAFATLPDTPLAVVTDTVVTVPEPPPEAQAAGSHTVPSKTRQLPLEAPPAASCDGWNMTVGEGTAVTRI